MIDASEGKDSPDLFAWRGDRQGTGIRPLEVVLTVGSEISSIDDIAPIFEGFVLPSWLPEHYEVQIQSKLPAENNYFAYEATINTRKPGSNPQEGFVFEEVHKQVYSPKIVTTFSRRFQDEVNFLRKELKDGEADIDRKSEDLNKLIREYNKSGCADEFLDFEDPLKKVDMAEKVSVYGRIDQEESRFIDPQNEELKRKTIALFNADGVLSPTAPVVAYGEIKYAVKSLQRNSEKFEVKVIFQTYGDQFICLQFHDSGFFGLLEQVSEKDRIPILWTFRPGKPNELYYPYIEPKNIRTVVTKEPHFFLAFQGGGAKGAAYIGAVQALKDDNAAVAIKTIIGSSAGGIIACALAAGCSSQELIGHCKKMTNIPKDTTIVRKEEVNVAEIRNITQQLKQAVMNYGIIPEPALYMLDNVFTDEFVETLLSFLSLQMDGVGDMFDLTVEGKTRKLNYYGLLLARLLKGKEVESIALDILSDFLKKGDKDNKNLHRLQRLYPELSEKLQRENIGDKERTYASALTMEMFYNLTGVEFTVTSVDIDDKLLRFFNHKTTPQLPVSKSVVMTGSFPVAFEALKWRSEWGKYYIHYNRWRRVIDLTGHQFTDGGMLANFPMMYFNNENMRPMYFAHKANCSDPVVENRTKIVGFGLNEIPDPQIAEKAKVEAAKLSKKLSDLASANISKVKLAWHIARSTETVIEPYYLGNIPLLGFAYKLLQTFQSASDNLVYEVFDKDICLESPNKTIGQMLEEDIKLTGRPLLDMKRVVDEATEEMKIYNNLLEDVERLRSVLYEKSCVKKYLSGVFAVIKERIRSILVVLVSMQSKKLFALTELNQTKTKEYEMARVLADKGLLKLEQLESMQVLQPLVRSFQQSKQIVHLCLICSFILKTFHKRRVQEAQTRRMEPETKEGMIDPNLDDQLERWFASPVRSLLGKISTKLQEKVLEIKRYDVVEKLIFEEREPRIRAYIDSKIRTAQSKNLQLVFQSIGEHNMFSYEIFKLVEDCLFKSKYDDGHRLEKDTAKYIVDRLFSNRNQSRQYILSLHISQQLSMNLKEIINKKLIPIDVTSEKKVVELDEDIIKRLNTLKADIDKINHAKSESCQITSITCSSMHSYFGFLMTTDLPNFLTEREIREFRNAFSINFKEAIAKFEERDWCTSTKCRINREFQRTLWDNRKDLFKELQNEISSLDPKDQAYESLKKKLKRVEEEFEQSKDIILQSYDTVLERLLSNVVENDSQATLKKLQSEMGLYTKDFDYFRDNETISDQTKAFMKTLLGFFEEQVRCLLSFFATEPELELVASKLDKNQQKDAWKIMMLTRFLLCDELRRKVQGLLVKLSLPKDITLGDYHMNAPRKLELTFPAVDISNKKMCFINQKTFPNMPVWAAVVVGSSLPMIFPTMGTRGYWCKKIDPNNSARYVKAFFAEQCHSALPIFVSGNLISSFPLDLLTNRRLQDTYFKHGHDYTLLNFAVDSTRKIAGDNAPKERYQYTRKYLSTWDLFKAWAFGNYSKMELRMENSTRFNVLSTYIEAHDNLVLELYSKELLSLPIRLSTLSFNKFTPVGGRENPVLTDMLDETYYYTKEKFHHLSQPGHHEDGITYLKLKGVSRPPKPEEPKKSGGFFSWFSSKKQAEPAQEPVEQKQVLLTMLSRERGNKDFTRKYKVDYQYVGAPKDKWDKFDREGILLTPEKSEIILRFLYPALVHEAATEDANVLQSLDLRVYKLRKALFRLSVDDLLRRARDVNEIDAIFSFDYKEVSGNALHREDRGRLSERLQLIRYAPVDVPECKSIVDVKTTGLNCQFCCEKLIHSNDTGNILKTCNSCNLKKGIVFECPKLEKGGEHGRYCLDCCKKHAILRRDYNLFCELGHPYIAENNMHLRPTERSSATCDLCNAYIETFYIDINCNICICTKCCTQFSVSST